MNGRFDMLKRGGERGFTLMESLLVVGLSTLIAVGIVAGLLEGLDTLQEITDARGVEIGHQHAMSAFMRDVQAATWFFNGQVHEEGGAEVLRETANPFHLILGYPGPDGKEIWIRYKVRYGVFSDPAESYLMRTVLSTDPRLEGATIITSGVANLEFGYFDADGNFTDQLPDVRRIRMTLSVNIGGATVQRLYDAALRNPNFGIRLPSGNFDDLEVGYLFK